MPISLGELAARFGCELIGDPDVVIDDVATLGNAGSRSISFLSSSVYKRQLTSTRAALFGSRLTAEMKALFLKVARRRVVLADSSKIGKVSLAEVALHV